MARLNRLLLACSLIAAPALGVAACGPTQRPDGGQGLLPEGSDVPDLEATDHRGDAVSLRGLAGRPALIYFYPRDGTPGCTEEACAFRDAWKRFEEAGVIIVGVSADGVQSHREFAEENDLPFSLISDGDLTWASSFGVGTVGGMTQRVSFLIGRDGKVAKVYPGVDPGVHAAEVLNDASALP